MTTRNMVARFCQFMLCVVATVASMAGCSTTSDQPSITYKGASVDDNRHAAAAILLCVVRNQCDDLLGDRLECGPFLWSQLKDSPALAGLGHPIEFDVLESATGDDAPPAKREGRAFETADEVREFWKVLKGTISLKELKAIGPLSDQDCRIYWALLVGTKVEEPFFVLSGPDARLVMRLEGRHALHLVFIDNFQNVEIRD